MEDAIAGEDGAGPEDRGQRLLWLRIERSSPEQRD